MDIIRRLLNLIPHVTITVGGKPYLTLDELLRFLKREGLIHFPAEVTPSS